MRKAIVAGAVVVCAAIALGSGVPSIEVNSLSQDAMARRVTVSYGLSGAPAVVTADFLMKDDGGEWKSLGADGALTLAGDVNRLVENSGGAKEIWWYPQDESVLQLVATGRVKAVLRAWPKDNPPDYMAIDLAIGTNIHFYVSDKAVPGGVTDRRYKTDVLLMRRIPAKGVVWRMGRKSDHELSWVSNTDTPCEVTLTNDYYIGVYPLTCGQHAKFWAVDASGVLSGLDDPDANPVRTRWADLRANVENGPGNRWPVERHDVVQSGLILDKMRKRTGVLLDLPTEAQWEYACRAGTGSAFNNGKDIDSETGVSANLDEVGWYDRNSTNAVGQTVTHPVGLKKPNAWGLYDMHGNIDEICIDFLGLNASRTAIDLSRSAAKLVEPEGLTLSSERWYHAMRGGKYSSVAYMCRSAHRVGVTWDQRTGVRLWAPAVCP